MLKIAKITMFSIIFKQNLLLKVNKINYLLKKADFQPQYIFFFDTKGNTFIWI